MRVSKRERYALRMMIDLAQHASDGNPVGVRAIAERQDIARRYLEQIASQLRRAGLVQSKQGQSGGYVLARPPTQTSVGEILEAVAGPLLCIECLEDERVCDRTPSCPSRRMWSMLERMMSSVLQHYSLDDLLERRDPTEQCELFDEDQRGRCPLVTSSARRSSEAEAAK